MRKVFDNDMVAHLWANQSQYAARSHNGNFWFEGNTIYSYRTPIARVFPGYVLRTSDKYSMTTSSKHEPAINRALRDGARVFCVPHLGGAADTLSMREHEANRAYLASVYHGEIATLRRARSELRDYQLETLENLAERVTGYGREVMGEEGYTFPANVAEVWAEIVALHARRANDPTAIKRRAEREARRERERIEREARIERERIEREAREAEARAKWIAGEPVYWRGTVNGAALVRVRGDMLETSQGAEVPLAEAVRVFRMVRHVMASGQAWHRNGRVLPVGHFQVDHIAPDGTMRAGCHLIRFADMETAARAAGVAEIDGADTTTEARAHA